MCFVTNLTSLRNGLRSCTSHMWHCLLLHALYITDNDLSELIPKGYFKEVTYNVLIKMNARGSLKSPLNLILPDNYEHSSLIASFSGDINEFYYIFV